MNEIVAPGKSKYDQAILRWAESKIGEPAAKVIFDDGGSYSCGEGTCDNYQVPKIVIERKSPHLTIQADEGFGELIQEISQFWEQAR